MRRLAIMFAAALTAAGAAPARAQPVGEAIPGAEGWFMLEHLPNAERPACAVRRPGPDANLSILRNDEGKPVFIVARPDWTGMRGDARASLLIDGGPAVEVDVSMVHNLVITLIDDEALMQRLRRGARLDWTLPFGRVRTEIGNLDAALAAQAACLG